MKRLEGYAITKAAPRRTSLDAEGWRLNVPVAGLPMQALDRGDHLIIINNDPTYLNVRADAVFFDNVAEVLPAIAERVLNG